MSPSWRRISAREWRSERRNARSGGWAGVRRILGGGGDHQRGFANVPCDQIPAAHPADTNGHVQAFLGEIGNVVGENNVQGDVTMGFRERG